MKQRATGKARRPPPPTEYGVHLDVLGRVLIAQADERIAWHERTAAVMAEEIQTLALESDASVGSEVRNLVGTRRYRLALTDLATLEIKPKGIY